MKSKHVSVANSHVDPTNPPEEIATRWIAPTDDALQAFFKWSVKSNSCPSLTLLNFPARTYNIYSIWFIRQKNVCYAVF